MDYPDYLGAPAQLPGRGESARPAVIRNWRHAEWLAVAAVCFGAITSALDSGVITVSYPRFVHVMHRPLSQVSWLGLAPLITVVATLILFGKRADAVGRKRVYIDGFAMFVLGALGCFLCATSFYALVAFRVVEALGVAMVQANSVALIAASVHNHNRTTALGIQATAQAIGLASGPFLGGLLGGVIPWRGLFLISAPLALVAVVLSALFLPRSRTVAPAERLDLAGSLALAVAAAGLIGGLTMAAKNGWRGPTLGLVALGIVAAIALVPIERRARAPIFMPSVFIGPGVRRALGNLIVTYITFFALLVAVPFLVERDFHRSTAVGGAATMAIPMGLALMAPFIGVIRRTLSARVIVIAANWSILAGVLLATLSATLVLAIAGLVLVGLAIGASNTANNVTVMEGVDIFSRGVASGTVNLVRAAGSALGVAMSSTVIVAFGHHSIRPAMSAAVIVAVLGATLAMWPQRP